MKSTEERFWARVDKRGGPDACWTWTASLGNSGYGKLWDGGRHLAAHRYAWALSNGPIPSGEGYHGTCVLHACDNRLCCNPDHLFLGTNADNVKDMVAKGRQAKGATHGSRTQPESRACGAANGSRTKPERVPRGDAHWSRIKPERLARGEAHVRAKLAATDIPVIRARCAAGECLRVIAADYGVAFQHIGDIARRKKWAHIP